jgi:mono/diheme cytochrome c family protein
MNRGMQRVESKRNPRALGTAVLCLLIAGGISLTIYATRNWSAAARARRTRNPVPSNAETLAVGLRIYGEHCRSCHGSNGDGKGEKAAELSVAPGDFTDAQKMGESTDGELFWQITRGRLPMPAFADKLNEEERWEVVDYIRKFAERKNGALSLSLAEDEVAAGP